MNEKYEKIIHLPHHISKNRPQMSNHDRAAQFAPYSALSGYEDAVEETARLTDEKCELDDYEKELIDFCASRGVTFFTVSSDEPIEKVIFGKGFEAEIIK